MNVETAQPSPSSASLARNLEVSFQEGEVVFHEGDASNRDLYVLLEGSVEVCKGIFRLAEIRGPNEFLGELSMLLKGPRTATLVASSPCRMYRIPEEKVEAFFKARPAYALQLAVVIARRLEDMSERYEQVLRQPAPAPESSGRTGSDPEEPAAPGPATEDVLIRAPGLATLAIGEDGVEVADVEAPDLTFVNGRPVSGPTRLANGDKVQLGRYLLQFFSEHPDLFDVTAHRAAAETEAALGGLGERVAVSPPTTEMPAPILSSLGGRAGTSAAPAGLAPELAARLAELGSASIPDAVRAGLEKRLAVLAELDALDDVRREIGRTSVPAEVESEIARQARELARPPAPGELREGLNRLQARLVEARARTEAGAADAPDPLLLKAWAAGYRQAQILIERESLTPALVEAALPLAGEEPLHQALERMGAAPSLLFGQTILALALQARMAEAEARIQEVAREREEAGARRSGGILGLGRKSEDDPEDRWRSQEAEARSRLARARRDLEWLEPGLVDEFWRLYEFAAAALVAGRARPDEEPFVRAFLRWGLLGVSAPFLEPERVRGILEECADPISEWSDSVESDHVLYADEYLVAAARGWITPSIDEDLELNQRLSPVWKADRAWRRIIHSRAIEAAYRELAADLEAGGQEWRRRQADAEAALAAIDRGDPAARKREVQIKDEVQEAKVEAGRLERAAERILNELVPQAIENRTSSGQRMEEAGVALSQTAIARQEVAGIRRVCRLVAKLKEPYLPLALRAGWFPEREQVHDRSSVEAALAECERRDPLLFREALFPVEKKSQRILLRSPPVVLIAPAAGQIGFAWNPRTAAEFGRLVVPGLAPRGRMLEGLLWDLLSDFRYDTSKASAGVDFLKSDTLAAGYATVRWEYRKKSKESREKAAIYLEEKERNNLRRHYALYMKSALDGGKLLFFKCPEVYEMLLRYLDLPEGVERLKRG